MKRMIRFFFVPFMIAIIAFGGCDITETINIFTLADEVELGRDLDAQIRSDPAYKIFNGDPTVKQYIKNEMFDVILTSNEVKYRNDYNYQIEIIHDDSTLNAFATPGGYVYLYTGLLKYLDSEAALAGIIAHEVAHCERRHATRRLTAYYGISFLISIILGDNPNEIAEIAANLFIGIGFLANSRADEDEADEYAVKYIHTTGKYYSGAIKFFFEKLRDDGVIDANSSGILTFLSTHPDPIDRIKTANDRMNGLGIPIRAWNTVDAPDIKRAEYSVNIKNKL